MTTSTGAPLGMLDVVSLRVASGRWPAGTAGTIVETFPSAALVEITDDAGRTLDMVTLPFEALARVDHSAQTRLHVSDATSAGSSLTPR